MSWATAINDLRTKLNDGATDKLRFMQKCIGRVDGSNTIFKTFEFRRTTDFSSATSPFGVYVNQTIVEVANITSDTPSVGHFILKNAPTDGQSVEATFYIQCYTDAELNIFLNQAGNYLGFVDYTQIEAGLQPAVLEQATGYAYQKLSLKMLESMSDTYKMDDKPKSGLKDQFTSYGQLAKSSFELAKTFRDQFYTRQGQSLSPLWESISGDVRELTTIR